MARVSLTVASREGVAVCSLQPESSRAAGALLALSGSNTTREVGALDDDAASGQATKMTSKVATAKRPTNEGEQAMAAFFLSFFLCCVLVFLRIIIALNYDPTIPTTKHIKKFLLARY